MVSKKSPSKNLKSQLLFGTLVTGTSLLAGFSFFVYAFGTEGTRFDLYEYCFSPKQLLNPKSKKRYCVSDKRYTGITWLVAKEYETSEDFKKVTFLKGIKADRPNTAYLGLTSTFFMFLAWISWKSTTFSYISSLHKLIREKELQIIQTATEYENELALFTLKEQNSLKEEVLREQRGHANRVYDDTPDWERQAQREQAIKQKLTEEKLYQLKHSQIDADTAENEKIKYEARLAALKAKDKCKDDPWEEDRETNNLNKESLKARLQEHEDGWLWELVQMKKPLWLIGGMGSGKSNFAASLVLCRNIYNGWPLVSICDPQYHQNSLKGKPWDYLRQLEHDVYGTYDDGSGFNWDSIQEAMEDCFTRWSTRTEKDTVIQSLWDEITNYEANVNITPVWARRINSDPRKANEAMILLGHGKSKAATGGGEGLKEMKEENSVFIRLGCTNQQTPTFKGKIEGWKNNEGEIVEEMKITYPKEWFNPASILEVLNQK